jgi:hypothetical protein
MSILSTRGHAYKAECPDFRIAIKQLTEEEADEEEDVGDPN